MFRVRQRHQTRFYKGIKHASSWIMTGMLKYYQACEVEQARIWSAGQTGVAEFLRRNADWLAVDEGNLEPDNIERRMTDIRKLASSQCVLAVLTPFVTVSCHFRDRQE